MRAQPVELLRRDAVGVLGRGEPTRAHVLRVGRHAAQHLALHVGVLLDELRLVAVVDAEQVVQHEHLAVGAGAGADPDHRDLHVVHDRVGHLGGDRLEHDREAARLLQLERVVEHPLGALGGPALRAVAAERRRGLGREADVAHDRHAGAHDRPRALGHRASALELDRVAAGLLDEAMRGGDRLGVGRLVGAERQVADQQRRPQAAPDGGGEHQELLDRHRHGVLVAEHVVGGAVAYEHDVGAGLLDHQRARVVVGGDHHDRLAERAHLGELGERDRPAVAVGRGRHRGFPPRWSAPARGSPPVGRGCCRAGGWRRRAPPPR